MIEVNKLISALQDNVQSGVADSQSAVKEPWMIRKTTSVFFFFFFLGHLIIVVLSGELMPENTIFVTADLISGF